MVHVWFHSGDAQRRPLPVAGSPSTVRPSHTHAAVVPTIGAASNPKTRQRKNLSNVRGHHCRDSYNESCLLFIVCILWQNVWKLINVLNLVSDISQTCLSTSKDVVSFEIARKVVRVTGRYHDQCLGSFSIRKKGYIILARRGDDNLGWRCLGNVWKKLAWRKQWSVDIDCENRVDKRPHQVAGRRLPALEFIDSHRQLMGEGA